MCWNLCTVFKWTVEFARSTFNSHVLEDRLLSKTQDASAGSCYCPSGSSYHVVLLNSVKFYVALQDATAHLAIKFSYHTVNGHLFFSDAFSWHSTFHYLFHFHTLCVVSTLPLSEGPTDKVWQLAPRFLFFCRCFVVSLEPVLQSWSESTLCIT